MSFNNTSVALNSTMNWFYMQLVIIIIIIIVKIAGVKN